MKLLAAIAMMAVLSSNLVAGEVVLHEYVIERDLPGAGQLSDEELKSISQKSRSILESLGPTIKWQQSYVTGDKLYCIYTAPSEDIIREHAQQGGFPVTRISQVETIISPSTAD